MTQSPKLFIMGIGLNTAGRAFGGVGRCWQNEEGESAGRDQNALTRPRCVATPSRALREDHVRDRKGERSGTKCAMGKKKSMPLPKSLVGRAIALSKMRRMSEASLQTVVFSVDIDAELNKVWILSTSPRAPGPPGG
ncbi:hypothetical protein BDW71DRAFT_211892 [Aspergillus fruticulosus]